ncbi:glycosyltransferase [Longilinea arvoryzae]|uniref:Glycosyltransferase n=1 Tax=Longilinea arvoryzae TaxID=360412 RepID=A0A0S7B957_9CHLR|nr:glycosyltransferase family 4 protein [Longilinea arvoryzae]GAP13879.1 glycosyltransferase [Longilinea arvoryzae]
MHVFLVADGRSPITRRWINSLLAADVRVSLCSTFACAPVEGIAGLHILPIAFSGLAGSQSANVQPSSAPRRSLVSRFRPLLLSARYWLGPLSLKMQVKAYRKLLAAAQPDLVHALRIPFEGMLAASTPPELPLAVSIWGNDLTLHARGSREMAAATRRALQRADALVADAARDLRLAANWGFDPHKPELLVPGSGGIDLAEIQSLRDRPRTSNLAVPAGVPLVVNPRGFRPGSLRNDVFFQSIPLVLERQPNVHFVCPSMAGQPEALEWIERLKIAPAVHLLPTLPQAQLWELFLRSDVFISPSAHDGTPNSLLEAMACGCLPVVGDIESMREWITPGINGLLVDSNQAQSLAEAVLLGLENAALRASAAGQNYQIIADRADVHRVRLQVVEFYQSLLRA